MLFFIGTYACSERNVLTSPSFRYWTDNACCCIVFFDKYFRPAVTITRWRKGTEKLIRTYLWDVISFQILLTSYFNQSQSNMNWNQAIEIVSHCTVQYSTVLFCSAEYCMSDNHGISWKVFSYSPKISFSLATHMSPYDTPGRDPPYKNT